ncbi:MAG: hypothetical protein LKE33_07585 [Acidaminococcus sp.]|jgi:phosphoglycerate dehydrogenase-like enzyme|nr:hypothetical protein [Acidaminococcus sp.]MCI2100812.1 hypothetical protein [Acidaminococcus sp.]MCI2115142.1 hypothetical protein [Acidaminococcus sp.]MCI2117218.1 hypothetical protein [Acidaminococcus sp.]
MLNVILAGTYPEGTLEKFQQAVAGLDIAIRAAVTQEEFDKENRADAIILRILKMPRPVIERFAPGLKMIMRWGVGYDSVDIKAAREHGIDVCNTPGANAFAVSELAVLLMLAVGRNLLCHEEKLHAGIWSRELFTKTTQSLNRKIVGIVGGGNIGRQVARKVQAFGASVQYYDPFRLSPEREKEFAMTYVDYDTLLRTSDVISYHVPLTDGTFHMLNRENIKQVKEGAIIVNTSRSGIIEDAAIVEAVNQHKILGAGLDCTEETPITKENPLLGNPNIIVTPHVGGTTNDIAGSIMPMIEENLKLLAQGEPLKYVVNK